MFAIGTVTFCDKRIQNTQGDKKGRKEIPCEKERQITKQLTK